MKKAIIYASLAACMCAASPAWADTKCDDLSISGVSDSVLIELKKKCLDEVKAAQTAASQVPKIDVDNLAEYASLGQKYGIALSEVAKSVGTTVNELAQTPVGIFMLVLVAWKVIGKDLVGIIGAFIWFATMLPLLWVVFSKLVLRDRTVTENVDPTTGKVVQRTVAKMEWSDANGLAAFVLLVVLVAVCIAGFVMAF
jgi:hypothetical protein